MRSFLWWIVCILHKLIKQTNAEKEEEGEETSDVNLSIFMLFKVCVCVCIYKHNYEPAHDYYCRINGAIYFIMIFCIRRFVAVNGSVAWVLGALKYFCVVLSCLVLSCVMLYSNLILCTRSMPQVSAWVMLNNALDEERTPSVLFLQ